MATIITTIIKACTELIVMINKHYTGQTLHFYKRSEETCMHRKVVSQLNKRINKILFMRKKLNVGNV